MEEADEADAVRFEAEVVAVMFVDLVGAAAAAAARSFVLLLLLLEQSVSIPPLPECSAAVALG